MKTDSDTIDKDVGEVRSDLAALKEDLSRLRSDMTEAVSHGYSNIKNYTAKGWNNLQEKTCETVKNHPYSSLLGAAAAGAVVAWLLKRR